MKYRRPNTDSAVAVLVQARTATERVAYRMHSNTHIEVSTSSAASAAI